MKSRRLAQGIPESLAQTDSSGSVCQCMCVKESLCSWVTFSSFPADPPERRPQSQTALHWGQERSDQGNAWVGVLWCYRDCEGVADVPTWVGHLKFFLVSHILPKGTSSFKRRDYSSGRNVSSIYPSPLVFLQRPTLAWRSACIVPAILLGLMVTLLRMPTRCWRSSSKVRLYLVSRWFDKDG